MRDGSMAIIFIGDVHQMTFVALQAFKDQARAPVYQPGQPHGLLHRRYAAAMHADIQLHQDAQPDVGCFSRSRQLGDIVFVIDAYHHCGLPA